MNDITLENARAAVSAAIEKSQQLGLKMDIAVVDAGANLKAFARMDGAWLGSIDIAIKKARTARFFDMNTGDIGGLSQPGGSLYNVEHSNGGMITYLGGAPMHRRPRRLPQPGRNRSHCGPLRCSAHLPGGRSAPPLGGAHRRCAPNGGTVAHGDYQAIRRLLGLGASPQFAFFGPGSRPAQ